jgi:signal transduction histidine kinase/CheY-like chemotaxis protein
LRRLGVIYDRAEKALGIDRQSDPGTLVRMRGMFVLGFTILFLQAVNLVTLTWSYGPWSTDHTISVVASLIVAATIIIVQRTRNFIFYVVVYTALSLTAIGATALKPTGSGIDTSLLPFLCIGPLIVGYIYNWKAALAYSIVAAGFLGVLFWSSASPFLEAGAPIPSKIQQRLAQSEIALVLATVLAMSFSQTTFGSLRRQQETIDRAIRAEAAKSQFLATMSHELRTPLNGVIGLADALSARELGQEERELASTISRSGKSLLVIINDLLDLSKIDAGKLTIEPNGFSPAELVRHVADTWREPAESKDTSILVDLPENLPPSCFGDEQRIGQILMNLMSNAVKFTENGTVRLSVLCRRYETDAALTFRVRDSGRGIPEAKRHLIFEPFEQGEHGTTRSFGGTGLGLPICRRLAELMEGSIALESSGSEGSTFVLTLRLPYHETRPPLPTVAARKAFTEETSLAGLRVLVAEDNQVNQMVMREFLRLWGMQMVLAEDGPSTLEALETAPFDLLLLDKHMPGMSGLDVAIRIRRTDAPYRSIPIIGVSADSFEEEREEALAAGMDAYVAKPVKADVLREAILTVLGSGAPEAGTGRTA